MQVLNGLQWWTLFWSVQSVQQLLAGADRLAAVVLCMTPSGMALFDLPAGSHCTAAVPPPSL